MLGMLEFVSSFLTRTMEKEVKKKHQISTHVYNLDNRYKDEFPNLHFSNVKCIYIVDFQDKFIIDLPKAKIYVEREIVIDYIAIKFSKTSWQLGELKFLEIYDFDFRQKIDEHSKVKMKFKKINVFNNTIELIAPFFKTINLWQFIPSWSKFNYLVKNSLDETYKEKYIQDYAKKETLNLEIESIILVRNEHPICNAGIFRVKPEEIEKLSEKEIVNLLKERRSDEYECEIKHFVLVIDTFEEQMMNNNYIEKKFLKERLQIECDSIAYKIFKNQIFEISNFSMINDKNEINLVF